MAMLGFRHAQFSEDLDWLPDWLQHSQRESPKGELLKNTADSVEDIDEGKHVDIANNGNHVCHLYWSGEGSSQAGLTQPPRNVLHFHLHFSSYSSSSCRGSQIPGASELSIHPLQKVEPVSEPVEVNRSMQHGERVNVSNLEEYAHEIMGVDGGMQHEETVKVLNLEEVTAESVEIDRRRHHEERVIISNFGEAPAKVVEIDGSRQCEQRIKLSKPYEGEISDVVELLIAASEALVINESVESDSALRYLPMVAVVEMALRVKQARLEVMDDVIHGTLSSNGENCSSELLDDILITDALEDLGVSVNDHNDLDVCDMDISHVEETPISKNCGNCDNGSEYLLENIGDLCVRNQSDDISTQDGGLIKCSSLELTEEHHQNQDNIDVDIAASPSILDISTHVDKISHASIRSTLNVSTEDKKSGSTVVGWTPYRPQLDVNLSSQYQEQNIKLYTASRFQSRWLGGWTEKEVDAVVPWKQQTGRIVAKPFVGEMSFLSESADVAPDENSVIQEQGIRRKEIASQFSIPLGMPSRKIDQGMPFSQEVARPLSPSSLDPLCSIVPCSLSVENPGSPKMQSQDDEDIDAEESSSPILGPPLVKPCKISYRDPKGQCDQHNGHLSTADEECSGAVVQRRLSSLKNYSMLLPSGTTGLENWQPNSCLLSPLERKMRIASSEIEMFANKPSDRMSAGFCSLKSVPKPSVVQYNEENHGSGTANPLEERATDEKSLAEFKGVAQVMHTLPVKRKLSRILNHAKRCRVQVSRYVANGSFSKEKQAVGTETAVGIQDSNNFHKMQHHIYNPVVDKAPREKKVQFAEAEIPQQQVDRSSHSLKSYCKNCSCTQSCKRMRCCKLQLDPRIDGRRFLAGRISERKIFIFQGMEFFVTGFSICKKREIEGLIQRHGGNILLDIPSSKFRRKRNCAIRAQQPIVIASKKLRTTKFLYGCAVQTLILQVGWLTDSISAGSTKSPEKYMIISYQAKVNTSNVIGETFSLSNSIFIFEHVGVMLHGKSSFFTKFATIIKHAGGRVFRTLHQLLKSLDTKNVSTGAIATEFENTISRHLRHCAMEKNIPIVPASWIVESLYVGKLLPLSV